MDIRQFILPGGVGPDPHQGLQRTLPRRGTLGGAVPYIPHGLRPKCTTSSPAPAKWKSSSPCSLDTIDLVPQKTVFFRPSIFTASSTSSPQPRTPLDHAKRRTPRTRRFRHVVPQRNPPPPTGLPAREPSAPCPNLESALKRRDLSLQGFNLLKAAFARSKDEGQTASTCAFYHAARQPHGGPESRRLRVGPRSQQPRPKPRTPSTPPRLHQSPAAPGTSKCPATASPLPLRSGRQARHGRRAPPLRPRRFLPHRRPQGRLTQCPTSSKSSTAPTATAERESNRPFWSFTHSSFGHRFVIRH